MTSITSFKLLPLDEPPNNDTFALKTQGEETEIFQHVVHEFEQAGLNVMKIEQLQNHHIWLKYKNERELMLKRRPQAPNFALNETYLYHGTSAKKDNLCEEGFDVNLATEGCFGKGIYFSDAPAKCAKYAKDTIIVARVLLGETKIFEDGEKDTTLIQAPKKSPPFQGWRFYDSIKGRPRNFIEYVVYTNGMAFIEYLITFSKKEGFGATPAPAKDECPQAMRKSDTPSLSGDEDDRNSPDIASDSGGDDADGNELLSLASIRLTDEDLLTLDSAIPLFTIPSGEHTPEKKKEIFKRITEEQNDNEIDSMFKKANDDLEGAIYLFYAYRQEKEDDAKREAGETVDDIEPDDGLPIYPPMEPEYNSDAWNALSEDQQKEKTDERISYFMDVTVLEETQTELARKFVSDAKYNLDTALMDYYRCWL